MSEEKKHKKSKEKKVVHRQKLKLTTPGYNNIDLRHPKHRGEPKLHKANSELTYPVSPDYIGLFVAQGVRNTTVRESEINDSFPPPPPSYSSLDDLPGPGFAFPILVAIPANAPADPTVLDVVIWAGSQDGTGITDVVTDSIHQFLISFRFHDTPYGEEVFRYSNFDYDADENLIDGNYGGAGFMYAIIRPNVAGSADERFDGYNGLGYPDITMGNFNLSNLVETVEVGDPDNPGDTIFVKYFLVSLEEIVTHFIVQRETDTAGNVTETHHVDVSHMAPVTSK